MTSPENRRLSSPMSPREIGGYQIIGILGVAACLWCTQQCRFIQSVEENEIERLEAETKRIELEKKKQKPK